MKRFVRRRQDGVFAILYAMLLVPMLMMVGLAVDLSLAYTRHTDMQTLADSVAVAAARALDGTAAGVAAAVASARTTAIANSVGLSTTPIEWVPTALQLAASPDGPWIAAADAPGSALLATLLYAKVSTAELGDTYSNVPVFFSRILGNTDLTIAASAIATRSASPVGPLAVCAISNTPAAARSNSAMSSDNELLEYGYRRGVSYNLLNLNPNGTAPRSFLINPVDFPPAASNPAHSLASAVTPFICSGTLAAPNIGKGSSVYVTEPFPASLAVNFNARLNSYAPPVACSPLTAPPDTNIKSYAAGASAWMNATPMPMPASAQSVTTGGKLLTVAEQGNLTAPAGTTFNSYGPLWSFAKPVHYDASKADGAGAVFNSSDWGTVLYKVASGTKLASSYSNIAPLPYKGAPGFVTAPTGNTSVSNRRVLYVPLLDCASVAAGKATVLAVGRFLLSSPATGGVPPAASVPAEFGGLVSAAAPLPAGASVVAQ